MSQAAPVAFNFHAPPITAELLAEYRVLAAQVDDAATQEAMTELCAMVELFQQTPASKLRGKKHPTGVGTIVPLEPAEIKRIWDLVPWPDECNLLGQRFSNLPKGPAKHAAFHLLWYARELAKDREPMTNDKL